MPNKKIILLTIIIMLIISCVRIAPVLYKSYAPSGLHDNLILARNLALNDSYKIENNKNVILSSSRVAEQGIDSTLGNKLTIYIESWFFKFFGFSPNLPFYISIFMFAISGILIFLLVLRLFNNYWLALSAFFIDLFMPFVWKGSLMAGSYEFASVFFLAGLLVYFWRKEPSLHALILAGLFVGLATISRNAFILSAIPIGIYELYRSKSWKNLLYFLIPVILIFGAVNLTNNSYLTSTDESFTRYGHLFPDPYTYHFEKEDFIKTVNLNDPEAAEFMIKYGYHVPFLTQLKMYLNSVVFYPKQAFSLINFGGPLFLFLIILAVFFLLKERKNLFYFIIFWLVFWYLGLIILKTNNWNHFLEIRFVIVMLITFGAWKILELFKNFYQSQTIIKFFSIGLIVFLSAQLFVANKWLFYQDYEASFMPEALGVIENINNQDLTDDDIIAISFNQNAPLILNYYTDKNFIYFAPETIEKLKSENKLEEVFKKFGITKDLTRYEQARRN